MRKQNRVWMHALGVAVLGSMVLAGEEPQPAPEAPKLEIGTKVGQKLPQFKADLWDLSKEEPSKAAFDSHATKKATAYVFMSGTCPYCKMYQGRLAQMTKDYAEKGIDFVMVYPTRATPAEEKAAYHKAAKLTGAPMVNDADASIAAALKITKTPEIVLTTKEGEIVFRGGIDDNPGNADAVNKAYLRTACDDLAAGRKVSVTSAPLYG